MHVDMSLYACYHVATTKKQTHRPQGRKKVHMNKNLSEFAKVAENKGYALEECGSQVRFFLTKGNMQIEVSLSDITKLTLQPQKDATVGITQPYTEKARVASYLMATRLRQRTWQRFLMKLSICKKIISATILHKATT